MSSTKKGKFELSNNLELVLAMHLKDSKEYIKSTMAERRKGRQRLPVDFLLDLDVSRIKITEKYLSRTKIVVATNGC